MARIILKDISAAQRTPLKNVPGANSRKRDQQWIDEALASGPAAPLTRKEMNAIRDRVLKGTLCTV
jgi:hypothetical protein